MQGSEIINVRITKTPAGGGGEPARRVATIKVASIRGSK
jgi:hypothetical protein